MKSLSGLCRQIKNPGRLIAISSALIAVALSLGATTRPSDSYGSEASSHEAIVTEKQKTTVAIQLSLRALRASEDNLDLALLLAVQAMRLDDNWETRDTLLRVLQKTKRIRRFLSSNRNPRKSGVAFSSNGRFIAYGKDDCQLSVYDNVRDSFRNVLIPESRNCVVTAISPDAGTFALQCYRSEPDFGNFLEIRKIPSGKLVGSIDLDQEADAPCSLEPCAFGERVRPVPVIQSTHSGQDQGKLYFRGLIQGSVCAVNPDGSKILCCDPQSTEEQHFATLWDIQSCKKILTIDGLSVSQDTTAFSSDGCLISGVDGQGRLIIWDVLSGEKRQCLLPVPKAVIQCAAFHPDGKILATADSNKEMVLWDVLKGQKIAKWRLTDPSHNWKTMFGQDGKTLASVGNTNRVTIWDLDESCDVSGLVVSDLSRLRDDPMLGSIKQIRQHNQAESNERLRKTSDLAMGWRGPVAFGPDDTIAGCLGEGAIVLIAARKNEIISVFHLSHQLVGMAFNSRGCLLTISEKGEVAVTEFSDGKPHSKIVCQINTSSIISAVFSLDGNSVTTFSETGQVDSWNLQDQRLLKTVEPRLEHKVENVAFCGNGARFATLEKLSMAETRDSPFEYPKTIRLWDFQTGHLFTEPLNSQQVFQKTDCKGYLLALSPDCKILAAMDYDGSITLFDLNSRMPLGSPIWRPEDRGDYPVSESLTFSNDGKALAVARGQDLLLLDVDPESWMRRACRKTSRNLTVEEWTEHVGPKIPYETTCP